MFTIIARRLYHWIGPEIGDWEPKLLTIFEEAKILNLVFNIPVATVGE